MVIMRILTNITVVGVAIALSAYLFLGKPMPEYDAYLDDAIAAEEQPAVRLLPKELATIDRLWHAICHVESRGNPTDINHHEDAVGIAQIRQICLADCNLIVARKGGPAGYFTRGDRLDPAKSREMFLTYVLHYAPDGSPEQWARIWNGGPTGYVKKSTLGYWRLVLAAMEM